MCVLEAIFELTVVCADLSHDYRLNIIACILTKAFVIEIKTV